MMNKVIAEVYDHRSHVTAGTIRISERVTLLTFTNLKI